MHESWCMLFLLVKYVWRIQNHLLSLDSDLGYSISLLIVHEYYYQSQWQSLFLSFIIVFRDYLRFNKIWKKFKFAPLPLTILLTLEFKCGLELVSVVTMNFRGFTSEISTLFTVFMWTLSGYCYIINLT